MPVSSLNLIYLPSVDSTNLFIKRKVDKDGLFTPLLVYTDKQTHGYGQQGRSWLSNELSLTFSIAYPIPKRVPVSGAFSLAVALELISTLSKSTDTHNLKVKWPNDLYSEKGKLAGILVERLSLDREDCLIIGIGINRQRSPTMDFASLPYFDAFPFFERLADNLGKLIDSLRPILSVNQLNKWQIIDYFKIGEAVFVYHSEQRILGRYCGIDPTGQAVIETEDGVIKLSSGRFSIRKV